MAVRRAPNVVKSDESAKKLVRAFVEEVTSAPDDGAEHRVALVVAGAQEHPAQLASLAALAARQTSASRFFDLVRTSGKFPKELRGRLDHLVALVRLGLEDLGAAHSEDEVVELQTWDLLSRLIVLMPRLETPDEADWAMVTNSLIPVARGTDLFGASRLRDRLVALAAEYAPNAATVDLRLLRRNAHEVLDSATRRHTQGWRALDHLHSRAVSVRAEIASADGTRTLCLNRSSEGSRLLSVAKPPGAAVVAHGESGVGKSALVLQAAIEAERKDPDTTQVLCLNLRHLPATSLEFQHFLGAPLRTLLGEMSAPHALLVIDGADAIAERMREPFNYLVDAAVGADVTIIAITANDAEKLVHDTIAERTQGQVVEVAVSPLSDTDLEMVLTAFSELVPLASNPRAKELLRRLVVVDLLVRGGPVGVPLSDADAMLQVWSGLVRNHERSERGTPDARELAMLTLADLALTGGDPLKALNGIDPAALEGLRHDGLLRLPVDDPFKVGEPAWDPRRLHTLEARMESWTTNRARTRRRSATPRS